MWQNSKTKNFTKLKKIQELKHPKCDQTQKTQYVTEIENSKCDKIKNHKCGKTQKLKMWLNSKT